MTNNKGTLAVRPTRLTDIVGQDSVRQYLAIKVAASRNTGIVPGHILIGGNSGYGKTTLSLAVANEMGVKMVEKVATSIKTWGDLASIIRGLGKGDILFVDEIHALPKDIQEKLYILLEDFAYTYKHPTSGQEVKVEVPPFTLIGATTHLGDLLEPLRMRFQYQPVLAAYSHADICQIVIRASQRAYGFNIDSQSADAIARMSWGTPRIAVNMLKNTYEVAAASGAVTADTITPLIVWKSAKLNGLDPFVGLDADARRVLSVLAVRRSEDNVMLPLGERALLSSARVQSNTYSNKLESQLLSNVNMPIYIKTTTGFKKIDEESGALMEVATRGRVITELGVFYLEMCSYLQQNGWFMGESLQYSPVSTLPLEEPAQEMPMG